MTLRWRPMVPDDFDVCDSVGNVTEYQRLLIVIAARQAQGLTLLDCGQPIAVIGVHVTREALGFIAHVWAFLSPHALRCHGIALARGLLRKIRALRRVVAAVEMWVDPAQPRALLLAHFLGFGFVQEFFNPALSAGPIWRMR